MHKREYVITGAIMAFVYALFSNQNIIVAFLLILTGALLGKAKYQAKEKQEKEFEELLDKDKTEHD